MIAQAIVDNIFREETRMSQQQNPVPDGYHSITPYLTVADAGALIEFVKQTFGAVETERFDRPDGTVGHAEVKIGDSTVMIGGAGPGWEPRPGTLYYYVADVDDVYRRALAAGATSIREPEDQFYGGRNAGIEDPCGNQWWIATRVEQVSTEEMQRRAASHMK